MTEKPGRKIAFSIDLEDWYQGIELPIDKWEGKEERLGIGLDVILSLLETHEVKGTFFVLGWIADKRPDYVKKIASLGHEVGSHGYSHEKIYNHGPEEFRSDVHRAKCLLEDLTGREVVGYRAPFFSITNESLWALDILCEEGYTYDCSVSPVITWRYGLKGTPDNIFSWPKCGLVEFPMSTFHFLGKQWGVGGAYLRILPFHIVKNGIKSRLDSKKPVMFYAHPWEFDPHHPKVHFEIKSMITHYLNLGKMRNRTERLLGSFKFTSVYDVISENLNDTQQH